MKVKIINKLNKTKRKDNLIKEQEIIKKANNTNSIRVLYKKTGQVPQVKIISNIYKLKKAIAKKNLDIIPYETAFIICTNRKKQDKTKKPNIILDFYSIIGDLILVDIDKKKREFKSLSQENIIWYTQDLINKTTNKTTNSNIKNTSKFNDYKIKEFYGRNLEDSSKSFNFEKSLIDVLVNIQLALFSILKGEGKK